MPQIPAWVALLLAFWMGSITGFVLAIVTVSRMNKNFRKREDDDEY